MSGKQYRVGIDVGLNSVGLAAIEVDEDGMPVRILNAQSVIHDGGVDPTKNKEAITRKNLSGVGRRARRMVRRRRHRLAELDTMLQQLGYPLVDPETLTKPFAQWRIRAELADHFIENDDLRRESIALAIRHIARHRGWRNPYHRVDSLLAENPYSVLYDELKSRIEEYVGDPIPSGLTPAQLVEEALNRGYAEPPRLRTSTKHGRGLLPEKLMQEDTANELKCILSMQRVDGDEQEKILRMVFFAVSPKGSAEKYVGIDPLDPLQKRALKASLAFQRYRIANVVTNLRVQTGDGQRPLTVEEKNRVFALLTDADVTDVEWIDVAEALGVTRRQILGVGRLIEDGEERIASKPPRMTTVQRLKDADRKIAKPFLEWWQSVDDSARESMIRLLSNTVSFETVRDDLTYADAIAFIDTLDDDGLLKLDTIDLPSGRAAYGEKTLRALTDRMLNTDEDLHEARKSVFGVSDTWHPPVDPIGAPLGNPSVDRVLKIVNRWLLACVKRWGAPQSIQIEHVRSGFDSVATARQYERRTGKRSEYRNVLATTLKSDEHLDRIRDVDIRRIEAIQRQNGECLYCGKPIAFSACEMDHIVPRQGVGSTNTRTNLAATCISCNRSKSNTPFALWVQSEAARNLGASLAGAVKRVNHFTREVQLYDAGAWRNFKREVVSRLKQTEADEAIDNRSIESVAWMADELHRRIDGYFNRNDKFDTQVAVHVFQGHVTASARRAGGIEGGIHFFATKHKTRLDRRHHAVDASVIAMMRPSVAQTLMERESLREAQHIAGLDRMKQSWKAYPSAGCVGYVPFQQWKKTMDKLLALLNDALDADRVVVRQPTRLSLGNSVAHDATIHPLMMERLGDALDVELVRRASTPALWCALTRLPDYDQKFGLPRNEHRTISVHGEVYGPDDEIGFFKSSAAQIEVRGGSADIGSAMHHARIYRCWKTNARGVRKYWYGMIRIFQVDLLRASRQDLFTYPLPPQSVSMRYGEVRTVQAIQSGNAEYVGWLCVGDELHVDLSKEVLGGQIKDFAGWCAAQGIPGIANSWVIDGLFAEAKLRLHPRTLASEGLVKFRDIQPIPDGVVKIVSGAGWLPSIDVLGRMGPAVIRRNVLGEPRWHSSNGLPCSWSWAPEEEG